MNWTKAAKGILGRVGVQQRPEPPLRPLSSEVVAAALFRGILEREPDLPDLDKRAEALHEGDTLEHVIRRFIASPEFHQRFVSSLVPALYRGILEREPDPPGLAKTVAALRSGDDFELVLRSFIASPEFRKRFVNSLVPAFELPDLTAQMPERYEQQLVDGSPLNVYLARSDDDMAMLASLIEKHRYYDRFGVWSPVIDADKQIIAATVCGLGAHSCFELGCFTGPVLSLLADAGLTVLGAELSHLAFAFAYPNVRDAMMYGDLLDFSIDRVFDVVLCMDVLEHVNPLLLDAYIEKLTSLLDRDGFLYLNAPMWGPDRVFGTFEEIYLDEWRTVGDAAFWRHWPCDHRGWPLHGHLVWASSPWWERKFAEHGLYRDTVVEAAIHRVLGPLFEAVRGRKSLFVLRRRGCGRPSAEVAAAVEAALLAVPGIAAISK